MNPWKRAPKQNSLAPIPVMLYPADIFIPFFGAFRSLLKYDVINQEVSWLFDPLEVWNEVGVSIVQNTFETYTNPQLAGKDKQLWLSNYRIVETQSLRKLLSEAR